MERWSQSKSRRRTQVVCALAASGLLLSAAHAQVDHNWLDRALAKASDLSAPWKAAERETRGTSTSLEQPWLEVDSPAESRASSSHAPSVEEPKAIPPLTITLVDALPYPWSEERRVPVTSELGDPWPEAEETPGATDEEAASEADRREGSGEAAGARLALDSTRVKAQGTPAPWFAPIAELADPWPDAP